MAQSFPAISGANTIAESRALLLQRDEAAASNFSGTAFPTANLIVGMRCHRTDLNKIYALKVASPATWIEVEDISGTSGKAPQATQLATSRTFAITGDATATAQSFNGTQNVSLPLTLAATGVTAGTYAKVTVDAKGRVTAGAALANADLPNSGVTAGTYTKVTVNSKGVVTGFSTLASSDLPSNPSFTGNVTATGNITAGGNLAATGSVTGGTLRLTSATDVNLTSTAHALQIGDSAGLNLAIDNNEIQARNNGAGSYLGINTSGGDMTIGGSAATSIIRLDCSLDTASEIIADRNEMLGPLVSNKLVTPSGMLLAVKTISVGFGSWSTPSRVAGTVYSNTTNRPILISVIATANAVIEVDDGLGFKRVAGYSGNSNNTYVTLQAIIPTGSSYRVPSGPTINEWAELR